MKAFEDNNIKNMVVLYLFISQNLHFVEIISIFAPVFI